MRLGLVSCGAGLVLVALRGLVVRRNPVVPLRGGQG